jgi:uncharacterized protein (DUF302 family)
MNFLKLQHYSRTFMAYFISRTLPDVAFEEAKGRVERALQAEGFGVLTEIDIKETMKKKLNKDYLPHVILGACSPAYADKVLQEDPHISTLLPCNVTVRELETGGIEVSAIDPVSAMSVVNNKSIGPLAGEVKEKLARVLRAL